MNYRVTWEQNALNDLDKLDPTVVKRVLEKITRLPSNFDDVKPEALKGKLKGYYKLVVGHYRVVYSIERRNKTLVIEKVGHRSTIYK
jgi:mRNA interferase RelE/StbE